MIIPANPGFFIASIVASATTLMGVTTSSMPIIGWFIDGDTGHVRPVTLLGIVELHDTDKITGAGTTWTCEQLAALAEQHRQR